MRTAEVGIVEQDDIARLPLVEDGQRGRDAIRHRAQMGRDVRGLGHQPPAPVKERAGEVKALFDVGGIACALQRDAHLLGDAAVTVAVQFQGDEIGVHF